MIYNRPLLSSLVVAAAVSVPGVSFGTTLYSGVGLPQSQGWSYTAVQVVSGSPAPWSGAVQTALGTGVQLDTMMDNSGYAGYSLQMANGALDKTSGFQMNITMSLISEADSSTPRAGLSVTLLTSDSTGIELAFRPSFIFAQNSTFSSTANFANFDTSVLTTYHLEVLGSNYSLSTDAAGVLLSGPLVSYDALSSGSPLAAVYLGHDLLAISDNTSQASGKFALTSVTVVPEASSVFGMLGLAVPLMGRRRVR